jgi:diguanylate cyclase (GGDEF)-like protein
MLNELVFPVDDPRQLHRLKRWLMAASASMLAIALFFAAYLLGLLGRDAFATAALATLAFIVLFYAAIRSGLNLRFRDASLTRPQILAASLVILYTLYHSRDGQAILALIYVMAFLFGVFRLRTGALLSLTALVGLAYALVIAVQWYPDAATDPIGFKRMVLNWVVLTSVLAFSSILGGYVSKLRKDLADSKVRLEEALRRIERLVSQDELTGVHNRRSLTEFLVRQKSRADRFGTRFSVLMLDLDNFKIINDTHGHHVGDSVLHRIAREAAGKLRQTDVFGRYGGEEFLAILEQIPAQNVAIIGERMCAMLRALSFDDLAPGLRVTVSIGGADYQAGESWQATVERADRALYRAKSRGRDCFDFESADSLPMLKPAH